VWHDDAPDVRPEVEHDEVAAVQERDRGGGESCDHVSASRLSAVSESGDDHGGGHRTILVVAAAEDKRSESGIELKPIYTDEDAPRPLELPGEYPFTRGPHRDMYRGRPWTIRQYAGFASAEESNRRYRYLLAHGQTGLSIAFDLPTQLGYDSDDPRSVGEVGRTGVAIDSLDDMKILLDGIPLGEVSTSMTINAPASLLLLLYELVAEQQGVASSALRGTVQNDILKEYVARGNYIFPPRPSMRLTTDLFAYCAERIPKWNTISISGYHIREAGATAVQELAFTLSNGIAYCQAAVDGGLSPDEFGRQLSFFFNAHNDFFVEVAKFRAARRLWARIMTERFGATNARALALRFHAQTGGSTLTAQQPENNIVRVAIQAFAAVCGGTQSLHTNGFDEALALPTERSAKIALRTQQLIAAEAGTLDTADPLGGSYFIEALTNELETQAWDLIDRVDELGGAVEAIEQGFVQDEIEQSAFEWQRQVERGERVIVGVNRYVEDEAERLELHRIDPEAERRQLERTARVRAERNAEVASRGLAGVREAARGDANLLPPMREALRAHCTIGEICETLRAEWGMYDSLRSRP
jgi:methylmalonyl-CoA mutase N-terminal domain/subunit